MENPLLGFASPKDMINGRGGKMDGSSSGRTVHLEKKMAVGLEFWTRCPSKPDP